MKISYSSNNSGGSWWLKDAEWKALEAAGWEVEWNRFLGAPAQFASKEFASVKDALLEFERVTDQCVSDEGCNCCGPPHSFSWDDDSVSGEDCLEYLYSNVPKNLREAAEILSRA